jgi:hypothetical protein
MELRGFMVGKFPPSIDPVFFLERLGILGPTVLRIWPLVLITLGCLTGSPIRGADP